MPSLSLFWQARCRASACRLRFLAWPPCVLLKTNGVIVLSAGETKYVNLELEHLTHDASHSASEKLWREGVVSTGSGGDEPRGRR